MSLLSPAADRARVVSPARDWASAALAVGYFAYALVGLHPMGEVSVEARAEGSPLDRIVALGLFVAALAMLAMRRGAIAEALRRNPPLLLVSVIILASLGWSAFPDLTLRRAILYWFLLVSGAAVAIRSANPARLHNWLFAIYFAVVMVNLLATVANPGSAISDIGVRGIYPQKNVAGHIAMSAFMIGAFWIAGQTDPRARRRGAYMLAPIFAFLVATRSKTSLALALVATLGAGAIWLAERGGARTAILALGVLIVALGGAFIAFASIGFDVVEALTRITGDATFTGRDELWAFALREIGKAPWLGHGYGAFWDVGAADDPVAKLEPGTWLGDTEVGVINQAHNGYLDLALNIGWPATALAALAIVVAFVRAFRLAHDPLASRAEKAAHACFATLLLTFLWHNGTEASLCLRGAQLWSLVIVIMFAPARAAPRETFVDA